MVEENESICPANYLAHEGDVEWVQPYASVDERKFFESGVAGDPFLVWAGLNIELFHLISM